MPKIYVSYDYSGDSQRFYYSDEDFGYTYSACAEVSDEMLDKYNRALEQVEECERYIRSVLSDKDKEYFMRKICPKATDEDIHKAIRELAEQ